MYVTRMCVVRQREKESDSEKVMLAKERERYDFVHRCVGMRINESKERTIESKKSEREREKVKERKEKGAKRNE